MEHIWNPWRYKYVTTVDDQTGCVFCHVIEDANDEKNFIIHRAKHNYVILNIYPYTSGHTMVVPYKHIADLSALDQATTSEMMELAKQLQKAMKVEYRPHGYNIGMNQGRSAGAGIREHAHLHVVPRWAGDASFVSVIGETRTLPEALDETLRKLKKHFQD